MYVCMDPNDLNISLTLYFEQNHLDSKRTILYFDGQMPL